MLVLVFRRMIIWRVRTSSYIARRDRWVSRSVRVQFLFTIQEATIAVVSAAGGRCPLHREP